MRPTDHKPLLVLTCGDPAGIGPEVVVKAWHATPTHRFARLRVVADPAMLADAIERRVGLPRLAVRRVSPADDRESTADTLLVIVPGERSVDLDRMLAVAGLPGSLATPDDRVEAGVVSAAGGARAAAAVVMAALLVREGHARGLVTGPLHKSALHAAGFDVPGHTELLARLCGLRDEDASMMLWLPAVGATGGLGVVHATLHEPLARAVARLSTDEIVRAGIRLADLLGRLVGSGPRIGVAALNPHAGESGLFGDEETRLVEPAVRQLVAAGVDAVGPLPADTLFLRASRGEFAGVVALYHDQGHIPIKLLGMHRAVNITLGLPLVRTSAAQGTAFDLGGSGAADPASMLAAIDAAARLCSAGLPTESSDPAWLSSR
ncbi:MAG: 4-hydroxythreonine-4-phosphate dehydrogenase PdxA [Planctomycetia bacterium]